MKKLNLLVVFAFMTGLLALPVLAQDGDSIVDNLASDAEGRFTTFVAALEAAGLAETLSAEGDFTVFAPTNDKILKAAGGTILWTDPRVKVSLWLEPASPEAGAAS